MKIILFMQKQEFKKYYVQLKSSIKVQCKVLKNFNYFNLIVKLYNCMSSIILISHQRIPFVHKRRDEHRQCREKAQAKDSVSGTRHQVRSCF